jgi:hypothetical protein
MGQGPQVGFMDYVGSSDEVDGKMNALLLVLNNLFKNNIICI